MPPTRVRYLVVAATCLVAFFMYIDRACISQMKADIQGELVLTELQMDWVFSAFFWSYALAQVPAGLLGKRLGFRHSLAIMLFAWSVCTAICGWVGGVAGLFAARLAVGLAEAGAYPVAASLVKGWFPASERGRGSGLIALGGRVGWAVSQHATPRLAPLLGGWRGVLVLFGVVGVVWSFVFWLIVRDRPRQHPWSNAAEADRVGPVPTTPSVERWSVSGILVSRNMWLFGLVQFGVNVGWAFLLTKMPAMLQERYGATDVEKGDYSAWPAWAACAGMIAGAFVGDWAVRRFGPRWGRNLPIGVMLLFASASYFACLGTDDARVVALLLALMALSIDVGIPSIWAFAQDVGGDHVAPTLGWGNMWGNLGAAASTPLLGRIKEWYGWDTMFVACSACFAVAAVAALCLNATRPNR